MSTLTRSRSKVPTTEKDFQRAIVDIAQMLGWRVAHFRPALTKSGRWMTAVAADGSGFPDLVMLRNDRILVRELKVGYNKASEEQGAWLSAFRLAGIDADVWTDRDLHGRVLEELK